MSSRNIERPAPRSRRDALGICRILARAAFLAVLGLFVGFGAFADDPEMRHELDELTLRSGAKPWIRLFDGEAFPTERTIFRDTVTGAETWRLTDDVREEMHEYYDIPVWNSIGSHLILLRPNELFLTDQWVMPADASWTRPAHRIRWAS